MPAPWARALPPILPTPAFPLSARHRSSSQAEPQRGCRKRIGDSPEIRSRRRSSRTRCASLVTPGNFEDDLAKLKDCDWIIEAVTENLEIKRACGRRWPRSASPDTIVSHQHQRHSAGAISEGFPTDFRAHFLGTHFFNPPRYLHLVEMIPGAETAPESLAFVRDFCDRRLGKGVVDCKDTPNFIANRIGSFFGGTVQKLTVEDDYTIEEVDALTGPADRPSEERQLPPARYCRPGRLGARDAQSLRRVPDDPWRDRFVLQPFLQTDDRARLAGRQDRAGLLQEGRQQRQEGDSRPSIGRRWNIIRPRKAEVPRP